MAHRLKPYVDLTGHKYGRLTVIELAERTSPGKYKWRCRCECGKEVVVLGNSLRTGNTLACGCLYTKHKGRRTIEYRTWMQIRLRCHFPHRPEFKKYGAKGIIVCEKWRNNFAA